MFAEAATNPPALGRAALGYKSGVDEGEYKGDVPYVGVGIAEEDTDDGSVFTAGAGSRDGTGRGSAFADKELVNVRFPHDSFVKRDGIDEEDDRTGFMGTPGVLAIFTEDLGADKVETGAPTAPLDCGETLVVRLVNTGGLK